MRQLRELCGAALVAVLCALCVGPSAAFHAASPFRPSAILPSKRLSARPPRFAAAPLSSSHLSTHARGPGMLPLNAQAIAVTSIVERTWSGMPKLSSTALFKPQLTAAAAVATGCVVGALVAYLLQPYFMARAVKRAWEKVERYREENDDCDTDMTGSRDPLDLFRFGDANDNNGEDEYEYEYEYYDYDEQEVDAISKPL